MKSKIKLAFYLIALGIISLSAVPLMAEDEVLPGEGGVNCNCTLLGKCKASGSGAHCAGSEGNINCQDWNGNC